jgi:small-conductance mechanosensitive channel
MMHYDLNKTIVERFRAEGLDFPYPTRTIINPTNAAAATAASLS